MIAMARPYTLIFCMKMARLLHACISWTDNVLLFRSTILRECEEPWRDMLCGLRYRELLLWNDPGRVS